MIETEWPREQFFVDFGSQALGNEQLLWLQRQDQLSPLLDVWGHQLETELYEVGGETVTIPKNFGLWLPRTPGWFVGSRLRHQFFRSSPLSAIALMDLTIAACLTGAEIDITKLAESGAWQAWHDKKACLEQLQQQIDDAKAQLWSVWPLRWLQLKAHRFLAAWQDKLNNIKRFHHHQGLQLALLASQTLLQHSCDSWLGETPCLAELDFTRIQKQCRDIAGTVDCSQRQGVDWYLSRSHLVAACRLRSGFVIPAGHEDIEYLYAAFTDVDMPDARAQALLTELLHSKQPNQQLAQKLQRLMVKLVGYIASTYTQTKVEQKIKYCLASVFPAWLQWQPNAFDFDFLIPLLLQNNGLKDQALDFFKYICNQYRCNNSVYWRELLEKLFSCIVSHLVDMPVLHEVVRTKLLPLSADLTQARVLFECCLPKQTVISLVTVVRLALARSEAARAEGDVRKIKLTEQQVRQLPLLPLSAKRELNVLITELLSRELVVDSGYYSPLSCLQRCLYAKLEVDTDDVVCLSASAGDVEVIDPEQVQTKLCQGYKELLQRYIAEQVLRPEVFMGLAQQLQWLLNKSSILRSQLEHTLLKIAGQAYQLAKQQTGPLSEYLLAEFEQLPEDSLTYVGVGEIKQKTPVSPASFTGSTATYFNKGVV